MVDKNKRGKIFVLDTNVPLHNWKCIYSFEKHNVKISTEVLEELDTFKNGIGAKHYNARQFIKTIDALRSEKIEKKGKLVSKLSNGGVSLGVGLGTIEVVPFLKRDKNVVSVFSEKSVDNNLLSVVEQLRKSNTDFDVIFVTKDINLRLKADSLNLLAEDYKKDQLKNIDSLPKGRILLDDKMLSEVIDELYDKKNNGRVSYIGLENKIKFTPIHNLYAILKAGKKSVLVRVDKEEKQFVRLEKLTKFGITPRNAEQVFAMDAALDFNIKLITLYGPAGTGKTLIAMLAALDLLKREKVSRIIISAAIVPVDNKDIGFLPGDVSDKISPYMQGIYDNISLIKTHVNRNGDQTYLELFNSDNGDRIEIQPLSFMRGRSITNSVFISDEVQNTTPHEMLTLITRIGENTKIILCGDIKQVDAPYLNQSDNGLVHVISRFQGQKIYANVLLENGERSELATLASELLS
jgi:PhoH-like ATPase